MKVSAWILIVGLVTGAGCGGRNAHGGAASADAGARDAGGTMDAGKPNDAGATTKGHGDSGKPSKAQAADAASHPSVGTDAGSGSHAICGQR